jgi:DNA polymerase III alpha subunit
VTGLLRRAISHFDPGKRMQELKRKFIGQAQQRNGIPVETGERIWEMIAAFVCQMEEVLDIY